MSEQAMCFMAMYRGDGRSMEIVVIAPSWKRAAEMADEYQDTFPNNLELVEIDKLSSDGALIDKDSL